MLVQGRCNRIQPMGGTDIKLEVLRGLDCFNA
jgi:hypothetical protein